MNRRKAVLIAVLLSGTVCLCGCDLLRDKEGVDTVDPFQTEEEAETHDESDAEDQQGLAIKGFRDMIADKYGEADNSGENSDGTLDYDSPDLFGE
ncbi:MAG: hypothetical protein IKH96_01390 [Ruminococcus sp.]|uniref:hypothetical protein n=1 Tax=Ruminococcus sp. TaxID=41978 RepID=UPI0025D555F8|nr:hypothetical protein [Ruminococcus sp.]MBR6994651.1 hypothetical protein [Ruminococcus sp.]